MVPLSRPRLLDRLLFLGALVGVGAILFLSDWTKGWLVENGPVEMLQLAALFVAIVLFVRASYRLDGWSGLAALGLACLSLLFMIRETPRCDSAPDLVGPCFPHDLKTLIYFLPVLLLVVMAFANPELRLTRFGRAAYALLPRFLLRLLPLLVLVPLIAGAQLADRLNFPLAEELLELSAYVFLALLGLAAAQAGDAHRIAAASSLSPNPRGFA